MKYSVAVLIISTVVVALGLSAVCQDYSSVGLPAEMEADLRGQALGGADTALPPTIAGIPGNSAGVGFLNRSSVYSSAWSRVGVYNAGQISVYAPHLGLEMHYVSFGGVPLTDEFGNIDGSFSFDATSASGTLGICWSDIPGIPSIQNLDLIATSLTVTVLREEYGGIGAGIGGRVNLDVLVWSTDPPSALSFLDACAIGIQARNILAWPMRYDSGHSEDWSPLVELGIAVWPVESLLVSVEVSSGVNTRFGAGVEWRPTRGLAVRAGLSAERVVSMACGFGLTLPNLAVDMAIVWHPDLPVEIRAALALPWPWR